MLTHNNYLPAHNIRTALALDGLLLPQALELADTLGGFFDIFKVSDLVDRYGANVIRQLAKRKPVFVDTKLHDTPTTVMNRANVYREAGASFVSVHAEEEILKAASLILAGTGTKVIAVTELTSKEDDPDIVDKVLRKAQLAMRCGIDMVTCSGFEAVTLRRSFNYRNLQLLIPGIVPDWAPKPVGQERMVDHRDALKQTEGRDCTLVIGRVVTQAKAYGMLPRQVAQRILVELLPPGSLIDKTA